MSTKKKREFCEIELCEFPTAEIVEVSEESYADSDRAVCPSCREAYSISVQHTTFRYKELVSACKKMLEAWECRHPAAGIIAIQNALANIEKE